MLDIVAVKDFPFCTGTFLSAAAFTFSVICVVGDSAKILLLPEEIASYGVYLLIQTLLTANRFKYAYGRKVTKDKYAEDEIQLPILAAADGTPVIDNSNEFSDEGYVPDWQFMENYIKSLPYGDRI